MPSPDAAPLPPTREVDVLFLVDNSTSMESKQALLVQQFPVLLQAMRSRLLGQADPAGPPCTMSDTSNCQLPDLHIGVIDSDLGAGQYSLETCETPGGDRGKLRSVPGKLSLPGCAVPRQPWIEYRQSGGAAITNVQNALSADPVAQVA